MNTAYTTGQETAQRVNSEGLDVGQAFRLRKEAIRDLGLSLEVDYSDNSPEYGMITSFYAGYTGYLKASRKG